MRKIDRKVVRLLTDLFNIVRKLTKRQMLRRISTFLAQFPQGRLVFSSLFYQEQDGRFDHLKPWCYIEDRNCELHSAYVTEVSLRLDRDGNAPDITQDILVTKEDNEGYLGDCTEPLYFEQNSIITDVFWALCAIEDMILDGTLMLTKEPDRAVVSVPENMEEEE